MIINLILAAFSLYRLARLVAIDDGPVWIMLRLRSWIDNKAYEREKAGAKRSGWRSFHDGVTCPYCVGLWLAVPTGLLLHFDLAPDLVWLVLGLAGVQSFLWRLTDG
jgi:hypothetical protein